MSTRALLMAAAAAAAAPGQVEFTTAGTYAWTVPEGVTSICCVLVQGAGSGASTLAYQSTVHCRALNGNRLGDGGGDGGAAGTVYSGSTTNYGGGGGAGGYAGNGGKGAAGALPSSAVAADAGSGGGGGGSCPPQDRDNVRFGYGGGGVGLKGLGSTGAAGGKGGSGGADGSLSDQGPGGLYGGGAAFKEAGALSYKNDIPVTPGTVVTIVVTGNGGGRILWGDGRFYPSTNTGDA